MATPKVMTKMKTRMMTELPGQKPASGTRNPIVTVLLLCAILTSCGLTAPRRSEGFASLDSLPQLKMDRTLSLSIGPALLHFAAHHIDDDPVTAQLLRSLDGVRIRVYNVDGSPASVTSDIQLMSEQLQADGWQPVLLIRDRQDGEELRMLVKIRDTSIRGLMVLAADDEAEVVVINLMGDIPPARFKDVMLALDIDAPGVRSIRGADTAN